MNGAFIQRQAVVVLAVACVCHHLYLIFTGLIPNLVSRPIHLALALPWVFVIGAKGGGVKRIVGYLICIFGVVGCIYIVANRDLLSDQYGYIEGWHQYVLGVGLILVVLEMARRAIKLALPAVAVVALLYGLLGNHLPGGNI